MTWQRSAHELPADKQRTNRAAIRIEWISIAFFVTAVTVIYLTLGSSQAMKAAWVEDILGFVPPIAFLTAARVRYRKPNRRYPYGYHRAVSIGYLVASLALLVMGVTLLWDSAIKLIRFEHASIGLVQPWGEPIWLGWFMLAALGWTLVIPVILGRIKMRLARELHDKVLYADAEMNKADWMTAGAAMVGVAGIGFGLWWMDAAAAIVISVDIIRDGVKNSRVAVTDLMDHAPRDVTGERAEGISMRVENELTDLPWVSAARVRMREEGHVIYGEAIVVPNERDNLVERIKEATDRVMRLDWRVHDFALTPVDRLPDAEDDPPHGSN